MVYMQTQPHIARTRPPLPNQEMPIVIDQDLRDCVADLIDRQERHEAKQQGKREGCSFTDLQKKNIDDLIRKHGITRPIYVWEKGEEWVIVDGHKVYEAAERLKTSYEVRIVELASTEDARACRWYVNVSANRRLTEDAIVFQFLNKFQGVIKQWRQQGKENQAWRQKPGSAHPKSKLFENREKINWMLKAAEVCQTTKYHIEKTQELWRAAQSVAQLTEEERAALTSTQIDNIKKIENGVAAARSGASSASTVLNNIKGHGTRTAKSSKGQANEVWDEDIDGFTVGEHQIVIADSLEWIQKQPVGAFQHLVGSPPYYGAKINYGVDIPWMKSWDSYCEAIKTYIHEAHRIIPDGVSIVIQIDDTHVDKDDRYYYHTDIITKICDELGMKDAGRVVWYKQNVSGKKCAMGSDAKLAQSSNHDYVLAFFKGEKRLMNPSFIHNEANLLRLSTWTGKDVEELSADHWEMMETFWNICPRFKKKHPAPFPDELAYRMLIRYTNGGSTVCDPWAGTGTTGVQCAMAGRQFIGVELGGSFAETAHEEMLKAVDKSNDLARQRLTKIERYLCGESD